MGALYLVATPIGNLEDITLRALRVLSEAELVLAEDTRRTRVLLQRYNIAATLRSFHARNEASRAEEALRRLAAGEALALVSDAGTPLLSDPGAALVRRAAEAGHRVTPVPGASAPLAALCGAGLPFTAFTFHGFLPRKAGARRRLLQNLADRPEAQVFFESPQRLGATLEMLGEVFGERALCVARELTKVHEEFVRGDAARLAQHFSEGVRGEITLVVAGAPPRAPDEEALREALRARLAAGASAREAASALHRESGAPRRMLYQLALAERAAQAADGGDGEDVEHDEGAEDDAE